MHLARICSTRLVLFFVDYCKDGKDIYDFYLILEFVVWQGRGEGVKVG